MKVKYLKKIRGEKYTGEQLRPLYAYLEHGILGNSVVSWIGPCAVDSEHMVDGEDLLANAKIEGSEMLHFIFEIFDQTLVSGVFLQRLFATIIRDILVELSPIKGVQIQRKGDDLFFNSGKLSISIATKSTSSVLVHFALNVTNLGTPVKTSCLKDLKVDPEKLAERALKSISREYLDIVEATYKVRTFL